MPRPRILGVESLRECLWADDLLNRLTSVQDQQNLVRDPTNQETVHAYDGVSRPTSVTRELNPAVAYEYDLRGRLARVANARGQVLDHLYEAWGGLGAVEHYPDETATDVGLPRVRRHVAHGRLAFPWKGIGADRPLRRCTRV